MEEINANYELIKKYIVKTPLIFLKNTSSQVLLKLESLQPGGSFKLRGALSNALNLPTERLKCGLVAVSGGNHAVAVAYTAKLLNTHAKVVIPKEIATQFRINLCQEFGATVELVSGRSAAFERANQIAKEENKFFVPPFDSRNTILGTSSIGLELFNQYPDVEVVFVSIGGGGLAAGVSSALKLLNHKISIIGVEPECADLMKRSLLSNTVVRDESVSSVADGLTPPFVGELCLSYCDRFLDKVITVTDSEIIEAMIELAELSKIITEPAGATAYAGYKKYSQISKKKTVCIVSGANISIQKFSQLVAEKI